MHIQRGDDVEWSETARGDTEFRRKQLAADADDGTLGCSLYELPPQACSWPYHYHTGNTEAIYVLAGRPTLRGPEEAHQLEAGDYVTLPAGDDGAHQLQNQNEAPARVLIVSTMNEPDVTVYPEMGKIGVFAGSPPGGNEERTVEGFFDPEDSLDYWEAE